MEGETKRKAANMNKAQLPTSPGEREVKEVNSEVDSLRKQIQEQLRTRLSDISITVLQEKLLVMQRSSYYLVIHRTDVIDTEDHQHDTSHLSNSTVYSLIEPWRLVHAMGLAKTQTELHLTLLKLLYQRIRNSCHKLEAFVKKCDQGSEDSNAAAAASAHNLQQTLKLVSDFEGKLVWNYGPLDLHNPLISNLRDFNVPHLSAWLTIMKPVIFDRAASRAGHRSVCLCWQVADDQPTEHTVGFEVQITSLHPSADKEPCKTVCNSYSIHITNLIPDRFYQFSVQRAHIVTLVYQQWVDTIILKTLDSPKRKMCVSEDEDQESSPVKTHKRTYSITDHLFSKENNRK